MRKIFTTLFMASGLLSLHTESSAQITKVADYKNNYSAPIGTFMGVSFREAGFSALAVIPGTDGKEFWTCSDRGVNVDCASANPAGCKPTYDKMFCFPSYAPKIHRVKTQGDSVQILKTITVKRPNATATVGYLLPTGFGSTATEEASTDTVLDCANFAAKRAPKDAWSIDCEAIAVDKKGNFWIAEENGPSVWKLDANGVALNRYSPYANLAGAQAEDILIDTAFKYRKNNRGFENMTIAPNGKVYAIIQSPLLYPTKAVGEATRVHRMIEIDPATNATRMFVYLNDGVIGTGANQIRLQDWKLGDMTAINDTTFLVLEAAARGTTDIKRMYMININGATVVNSGLYGGVTLEALVDSAGLAGAGVKAVKKSLTMDLLANGWDAALDKAEGVTIINDSTIAFCNDNDFGQNCPSANGIPVATTNLSHIVVYSLKGANKIPNFIAPSAPVSIGTAPVSAAALTLYPNPAADKALLAISTEKAEQANVHVMDLQGKIVYTAENTQLQAGHNEVELSTAGWQNGLYFVRVATDNGTVAAKLIVMH
ncbi:MAG TPA: esterase-like activity of phytase family protein [Chitinophagaceae bacterium]|nr:esterase-like activity of phytase family protein [Chitinophagaceae bacterium]